MWGLRRLDLSFLGGDRFCLVCWLVTTRLDTSLGGDRIYLVCLLATRLDTSLCCYRLLG